MGRARARLMQLRVARRRVGSACIPSTLNPAGGGEGAGGCRPHLHLSHPRRPLHRRRGGVQDVVCGGRPLCRRGPRDHPLLFHQGRATSRLHTSGRRRVVPPGSGGARVAAPPRRVPDGRRSVPRGPQGGAAHPPPHPHRARAGLQARGKRPGDLRHRGGPRGHVRERRSGRGHHLLCLWRDNRAPLRERPARHDRVRLRNARAPGRGVLGHQAPRLLVKLPPPRPRCQIGPNARRAGALLCGRGHDARHGPRAYDAPGGEPTLGPDSKPYGHAGPPGCDAGLTARTPPALPLTAPLPPSKP
mmetsp:Transcript_2016/g.7171  ORF Transcript_2016/g.7171 Transcript_2016/m.7171 type:complete len:302 (-) Transcript_2016:554-1459(-)